MGTIKFVAGIVGLLALLGAIVYLDRTAYNRGYNKALAEQNEAIVEYQALIADMQEEVVKWKTEQGAKLNAKVREIRKAKGHCLDTVIDPPALLGLMRQS